MKREPYFNLPYLEGNDLGKDIPQMTQTLAEEMAQAMLRDSPIPPESSLPDLLRRIAALEAGGGKRMAAFLARGNANQAVNSITKMTNFGTPEKNDLFTWSKTSSAATLTVQQPGDYLVIWAAGSAGGLNGGQAFITLNGDGAAQRRGFQDGPSNMTSLYYGTFVKGDVIQPWVYTNAAGQVDADRTSLAVRQMS